MFWKYNKTLYSVKIDFRSVKYIKNHPVLSCKQRSLDIF